MILILNQYFSTLAVYRVIGEFKKHQGQNPTPDQWNLNLSFLQIPSCDPNMQLRWRTTVLDLCCWKCGHAPKH